MADGTTITWQLAAGGNVSLCDGPARGLNKFQGPQAGSDAVFTPQTQVRPGIGAASPAFSARGNVTEDYSFTCILERTDAALAYVDFTRFANSLALKGDLNVVVTVGAGVQGSFLRGALLMSVRRKYLGVATEFTFVFKGGLWTIN